MLVLALQFSKGIAGVGIVYRHRSDVTLTGHAVAVELESSCRARGMDTWSGTLKTEEKTKLIDVSRTEDESYDVRFRVDLPTSAPTGNWFEPGRTYAGQRLNSSSLERR